MESILRILFISSLLLINSCLFAQDLQSYIDRFEDITDLVIPHISINNECDKMIKDLDRLNDDLEDILTQTSSMHPEDVKNLRWVRSHSNALEDFLRCVGNTSYVANYMTENDLQLVKEVIDFSITEVYAGKFCCRFFEVRVGEYISVVAFKEGANEIYSIKSTILSSMEKSTTTTEMGLITKKYRSVWSNGSNTRIKSYTIKAVDCVYKRKSIF